MRQKEEALPDGARLRLGSTRFRPGVGTLPVVFSPDGERMLVEASENGPQLHILEARTGKYLETLRPLSDELGRVLALSWTAQGIRVACQLYGGKAALLEYAHARVRPLEAEEPVWADVAAFSADGQRVAMVDAQGAVRVWNTGNGKMLARARPLTGTHKETGAHQAIALSADGQRVAWSFGDSRIHLYEVAARRLRPALEGHSHTVGELAFSPDGTRLASAAAFDEPLIRLWDVERGQPLMTLPAAATPLASGEPGTPSPSFTFVGAGARLLWLDGDALRSQELSTGAATSLPLEPVWAYGPLSVSPDGTLVVAREGHALSSWSLDTRELEPVSDSHWLPVFSLAVSPEGALVATSDDGGSVRLWELARGQCIGELALKTARDCLRFSPDGQWLAMGTAQGQLHLWSRGAGRVLHSFPAHKAPLQALAFSPDGGWLATCSQQGGEVAVWAVPGGERRRVLDSGSERLTALDCSPDGQWLVAGGMDGTLTFWSMPEGRPIHRVHAPDSSVHQVRFFPDGQRVLSAGLLDTDHPDDGPGQPMLQLWHTETGRLLTSRRAHAFPLAIAPDGRSLFHVPWRNPALCMEDAMTGEAPQTLGAVPEPECHAFSSDFSVWVTGHRDCTALVWDVARWGLTPELP